MTLEEATKKNPYDPAKGNESSYARYLRYNVDGFYELSNETVRRIWRMELTKEEEKICRQYGEPDADGKVHCSECPLVIDRRYCLCKANCTEEEWEERKDE